jgi:hypothetical protein
LNTQIASSSAFQDLTGQVSSLSGQLAAVSSTASYSALMSTIATPQVLGASTSAVLDAQTVGSTGDNLDLSGTLTVLKRTTLNDLGVTGKITNGLLSINGLDDQECSDAIDPSDCSVASINANGKLKFQSEAQGLVDFFNGRITLDPQGGLVTKGEITAKKLNIDITNGSSASLGQASILPSQTKVVVYTTAVTADSKIFVTARTKTGFQLSVTSQSAGNSFTVELSGKTSKEVKFDWWIVN